MRLIEETSAQVRAQCEACGAEQILRRFTSRPLSGRVRCEPEDGRWLQCRVCGDWSAFERVTESASL
jgi:hypothetical protein